MARISGVSVILRLFQSSKVQRLHITSDKSVPALSPKKALVKKRAEEGLWFEDVPISEIAGDEVLVKSTKRSSAVPMFTFRNGTTGRGNTCECR